MFVVFTLMVEDIFLVTKRKLHFCKTLNRKSISTSAVSPSAEYLAMVLMMFWVFFIDFMQEDFVHIVILACSGWRASGSDKQPLSFEGT